MPIQTYSFEKYISNKISANSDVINQTYQALEDGFLPDYIVDYKKDVSKELKYFEVCLIDKKRIEYKLLISKKEKLITDLKRSERLSTEIEQKIQSCPSLESFRNIYKEYNKTVLPKAHHAKKAGLDKLAKWILEQANLEQACEQTSSQTSSKTSSKTSIQTLEQEAKKFINTEASLVSVSDILNATQQILVEDILNNKLFNTWVSQSVDQSDVSIQAGKKDVPEKQKSWIGYKKPCELFFKPSMYSKYLELRKLWHVGLIKVNIDVNQQNLQDKIYNHLSTLDNVKFRGFLYNTVQLALNQRLLPRYIQEKHRDFEEKAIKSESYKFLKSLDSVLMAKPVAFNKPSLGVWPLKDGCYVAIVNASGEYISSTHLSFKEEEKQASKNLLQNILKDIAVEYISLPTQSLSFLAKSELQAFLPENKSVKFIWTQNLAINLYSEEIAKKDFADLHFDQSRAVFLARQLQSSFTEFLRLNLNTLSLTDTQHLLPKDEVKEKINSVVNRAIYAYGLNLNVCSESALTYLKSLSEDLAKQVIEFRTSQSGFKEVSDLKKVPNFTSELFEQVAGSFILLNSKSQLDSTRIHPNHYARVKDMARELSIPTKSLFGSGVSALQDISKKWKELLGNYSYDFLYQELKNCGVPESQNIDKPVSFIEQIDLPIKNMENLKQGLVLNVWAKRLTSFGVFADFGLNQQGLILLSALKKEKQSVYPGMWLKVKAESVNLTTKKFIFCLDHIYSDFKKRSSTPPKNTNAGFKPSKDFLNKKKSNFSNTKSSFKASKLVKGTEKNKAFIKTKTAFNNPFADLQSMHGLLKEKK
ncbi:MAG: hypothetical protein HAW60_04775 [Bdellovibrionales bacterium]|nr:hypothetical protein [Bdellovibrionales bacterium]